MRCPDADLGVLLIGVFQGCMLSLVLQGDMRIKASWHPEFSKSTSKTVFLATCHSLGQGFNLLAVVFLIL